MNFDALTILVPTQERYFYLARLLEYFDTRKIRDLKIIILDSSRLDFKEKITKKNYKNLLITQIFFDYGINFSRKISLGLESVESKFSVLCPDDDFLIMTGLRKAMKFLVKNPSYSSCGGRQYNYNLNKSFLKSKFNLIYGENTNFSQSDKPLNRIKEYLAGNYKYYSFYHVHRSEDQKKIWHSTQEHVSDFGLSELYPCSASLVLGKIKVLDEVYMIREPNPSGWATKKRIKEMYSSDRLSSAAYGLSLFFDDSKIVNKDILEIFHHYKITQLNKFEKKIKEKKQKNYFIAIKERLALRTRFYFLYFKIFNFLLFIRAYRDIDSILKIIKRNNISENELKEIRNNLYGKN